MPKMVNDNAWIIPAYWVVMICIALVGWDNAVRKSKKYIILFSCMAMFSYGHYFTKPIWLFPFQQNLMILIETVPATFLFILTLLQ